MMPTTSPAIRLTNVGKCYRIFANPQDRFKQALSDRFGRWFGRQAQPALYREHWALRDLTFEVAPGEAVGILGRNGAGKSTLLQIIAGTLSPTTGSVRTSGRITALLELGSGFNPDFTGRENVFHNAQILGLTKDETETKFDQIAAFADIGDFLDQPVKTYSSGMMMRLAFSVQTVLDPAILIVDEALAVGDARFQEKCFRRLRAMRDDGVSILFVTHDTNSITGFCDRAVLIEGGACVGMGEPTPIVHKYLDVLYGSTSQKPQMPEIDKSIRIESDQDSENNTNGHMLESTGRFGDKKVEIISVGIFDSDGRKVNILVSGNRYSIHQRLRVNEDVSYLSTGFIIRTPKSIDIFGITNASAGLNAKLDLKKGELVNVTADVDVWLAAGEYILHAANAGEDGVQYDCMPSALQFTVISTPTIFSTSIVNLNPSFSVNCCS